jgi:hypothetical protein
MLTVIDLERLAFVVGAGCQRFEVDCLDREPGCNNDVTISDQRLNSQVEVDQERSIA